MQIAEPYRPPTTQSSRRIKAKSCLKHHDGRSGRRGAGDPTLTHARGRYLVLQSGNPVRKKKVQWVNVR